MKHRVGFFVAVAGAWAASVLSGVSAVGCNTETIPNPAPSFNYQVVHGWPQLPDGTTLGQVSGVGVEASGNVLLFRRADRDWVNPLPTDPIAAPTVLRFDPQGKLLDSLEPATFAMPHGLTVDFRGHVWLTDVALQQVFELDAAGNILRSFGERGVASKTNDDPTHFNMPTGVAVASDGTFYVSDGYGNARVLKFGADGHFIMQWGKHGSDPGDFNVPHGIALGPDGNVYVADRGNARVEVFDTNGNLVNVWAGGAGSPLGRPWAIAFDTSGHGFVVDGGDQPAQPPDRARIIEVDKPTGMPAMGPPTVLTTFGSFGNQDGEMIWPHSIAVGKDGAVYVAEVGMGKRAQKFVKR